MFKCEDILQFLPIFQEDGFVFATVRPPVEKDGFWIPAHDELSATAQDFIEALHASGAISPQFMDRDIVSNDRSYKLRNDAEEIPAASLFEIAHVLTFLTRAERFTPGTITAAYDNGILTRVLKRISVIHRDCS